MEIGDYVEHESGYYGKIISRNGYDVDMMSEEGLIPGACVFSLSLITDQIRIHEIKLGLSGNKLWK